MSEPLSSIRKVVIPVAGLGTRLLPTTRALPKEMLPVGRYPAIQHVVEEMVAAGLTRILFITSRSKAILENQFDNNTDIVMHLQQDGRLDDLGDFDYAQRGVEFFYTRQQVPPGKTKPQGTGAAIAAAESFVDGEPFAVAYGDTIIRSAEGDSLVQRMLHSHRTHGSSCTLGVRTVPENLISRYGIVSPRAGSDPKASDIALSGIVEKPDPADAPSRLAVSARYIFNSEVFDEIRNVKTGPDGEIPITDAIRSLITGGRPVRAVQLADDEKRYDIGSHESYYKAFIDFALADPQCGRQISDYLGEIGR